MENPIKDNRIVNDKTFALRFLSFVTDIQCNDAFDETEKESMISYSTSLLKYQIDTATDETEINYLKRCKAKEKLTKCLNKICVY
tara:strand:- start:11906 stop:12160 length:255 start_codon:yes stop_codon:yes gene_type:complete